MNKDKTPESLKINPKGLILLWAFAESGIGGMLHALKLPFTGIFVGGIAVICITLLAFYTQQRKIILQALGIVLLIKLTVSPHSPWQAYVAVLFQGIFGYLIFETNTHFKFKSLMFCIICLFESAIQKILITLLIYGIQLMDAIDKAALTIFKSFGFEAEPSLVWVVFSIYISLHIIIGFGLGIWIPRIPEKLHYLKLDIQDAAVLPTANSKNNLFGTLLIGFFILGLVLFCIKWLVPGIEIIDLTFIFLRSFFISLGLIFIIGPLIKMLIFRFTKNRLDPDHQIVTEIMGNIPKFAAKTLSVLQWVNTEYSGFAKIKNFILVLIWLSLQYKDE